MKVRLASLVAACCMVWFCPSSGMAQPQSAPSSQPSSVLEQEIIAWADFTAGILEAGLFAVFPDPATPNGVFAAARGVLYRSADGGLTWERVGDFSTRLPAATAEDADQPSQAEIDAQQQQIIEDAAQELADELGVDVFDLLNDPNNLDLDERTEDRLAEAGFATEDINAPLQEDRQRRRTDLPFAIAVARDKPDVVLVATTSGLFRSLEKGASLERLVLPDNPEVRSVAVDASGVVILAGTTAGFFLSEDGGDTWKNATEPGLTKKVIVALDVDYHKPERVAVLTTRGIFLSSDGGRSFVPSPTTPPGFLRDISWAPGSEGTLFVASSQGLYRSKDMGASWASSISSPEGLEGVPVTKVSASPAREGEVFIATGAGEVFVSMDFGETFTSTGEGLPALGLSVLEVDPKKEGVVWVTTGEGLYRYGPVRVGMIDEQEKRRFLDAFRLEPSVEEVIAAAIKAAKLEPDEGRAERAEIAAYFPRLRLQVTWRLEKTQALDFVAGAPPSFGDDFRSNVNFSALAVWDIARLLTQKDTVRLFTRRQAQRRARLEARITKLYEERRAVQLGLLRKPPVDLMGYLKAELRLRELTALLDAASGGYFSKAREAKKAEAAELER